MYKWLRGYRTIAGMSQIDAAKLIGIRTAQGYGLKEKGKVPFTAEEMSIIKNELNSRLGTNFTLEEIFIKS